MGGGGPAPPPRTKAENAAVPLWADVVVDVGAGVVSACTVAPILMTFDMAVTQAAAGTVSLTGAVISGFKELLLRPHLVLTKAPYWMVAGVYSATYAAANTIDSVMERVLDPASEKTPIIHGTAKLVGVTATNMTASIAKDAAFARMFGNTAVGAKMPMASYALFATRDVLTIGGAFTLPKILANILVTTGTVGADHASETAQMISPIGMQIICTPIHLSALNAFNYPTATLGERVANVASLAPSTTLARMMRMAPAYGIGGVMNTSLTNKGRDAVLHHYVPHPEQKQMRARGRSTVPGDKDDPLVGFGQYPALANKLSKAPG